MVENEFHECFFPVFNDETKQKIFKKQNSFKIIVYDTETCQNTFSEDGRIVLSGEHYVNVVIAQKYCNVCIDVPLTVMPTCTKCGERNKEWTYKSAYIDPNDKDSVMRTFTEWLLHDKLNNGAIVVAHNGGRFDHYFLMKFIVRKEYRIVHMIENGGKFLLIELGKEGNNLTFKDSFNLYPLALAQFPKSFGLTEMCKGYFPYYFNTPDNYGKVLPTLPSLECYGSDYLKPSKRQALIQWHAQNHACTFNFDDEILKYARSDVALLAEGLKAARCEAMKSDKIDPLIQATTVASYAMWTFKLHYARAYTMAHLPENGYCANQRQSKLAIQMLRWIEKTEHVTVQHKLTALGERKIHLGNGHVALVDGFIPPGPGPHSVNYKGVVIEINGCHVHGCPTCYPVRDALAINNRSHEVNFRATLGRAEEIKSLGYAVRSIWTHDIKHMLGQNVEMRRFFESLAHVTNRLTPRSAFYGGMTKAMKIYHKISDDEEIKYLDVCSLYPYVNRMVKYMLGAPKVITDFTAFQVMTGNKLNFRGFIFCLILPPSKLTHPVLPIKANGNLHFPLCRTCCLEENGTGICNHADRERSLEGVWTSYEINKALANGYVLQETYEVYAWERWSESGFKNDNVGCNDKPLFAGYIEANLKPKLEASGYPSEYVGREDVYIAEIKKLEGVDLDPARIEFNPGRRFLSKLKLNALWGKVGQRPDQIQVKFFYAYDELDAVLNDPQNEIVSFRLLGEEMGVIRFRTKDEFVQTKRWTSPAIAAWTTACARLILIDHLEAVGDRAIYCDTDSVIFVQKKGENLLKDKMHTALGGLTDEEPEHDIVEIVCLGPKQYAYKAISKENPQELPKFVVKLRGISLTHLASAKINFDTMVKYAKDLMLGNEIIPVMIDERKIVRKDRQMILTRDQVKQYQPVNKKGFLTDDGFFRPYGFETD